MAVRKFPRVRKYTHGRVWKKGHSCSSNPKTRKHRIEARGRYFQLGPNVKSNLTQEAVEKHNELQVSDHEETVTGDNVDVTSAGSCKTFDTFASNWTNCTNISFRKFLTKCNPNNPAHKDRLAVLAAVTDVIRNNGGKETETEYFAALMSTLDSLATVDLIKACMTLISAVIKRVPNSVLKVKFSEFSKIFLDVLSRFVDGEHTSLCKALIGCLSVLLRVQEAVIWSNASTLQAYQFLLTFSTHLKTKVRISAHLAICRILKTSTMMLSNSAPPHHPATSATAKFCIHQLEFGTSDILATCNVLNLLRNVASTFPRQSLKSCCENILRLLASGDVTLSSTCFNTLHGIFRSQPKASNLPAELQAQLITALYDFQPSDRDAPSTVVWVKVVQEAHKNLKRLDEKLCLSHLTRFFSVATQLWLSLKLAIWPEVANCLQDLLHHCANKEIIQAVLSSATAADSTPVHKILKCLEGCLTFGYNSSWRYVLLVIATFFEKLADVCCSFIGPCVRTLVELHNMPQFEFVNELEHAVGMAVRHAGPRVVIDAVCFDLAEESLEQSWLMPVFRENIRETELACFVEYFLPLDARVTNISKLAEQSGKLALAKTFSILHNQIWSLLPGFCILPKDFSKYFPKIAKTLGNILTNCEDQRNDIMSAVRNLILQNLNNDDNRLVMEKYAKNFIPILLNLYTKEDCNYGQRMAALDTFQVYLQIADPQMHTFLLDKAIEKLQDKESTKFLKSAIFNVFKGLLPYCDEARIKTLYDIIMPLLQAKRCSEQKKAYRLLEVLSTTKSDVCASFIQKILSSLRKKLMRLRSCTLPSAKAARLRCLGVVVQLSDKSCRNYLRDLIPEVVLCTTRNSLKIHMAALRLLVKMLLKLIEFDDNAGATVHEFVNILTAGFAGSPHAIASTFTCLTIVFQHFKNVIAGDVLQNTLENSLLLLTSENRQVASAAFKFVTFTTVKMGVTNELKNLESVVQSLGKMKKECRLRLRVEIRQLFQRFIRKFGNEIIERLAAKCYERLIRSIRKEENKRKRLQSKNGKKSKGDLDEDGLGFMCKPQTIEDLLRESESESEEEPMHNRVDRRKVAATWIQEDANEIVDFLDPKVSRNIMAVNPEETKSKRKREDFPVAPDGRLVILNDDEKKSLYGKLDDKDDNIKMEDDRGKKRKLDEEDDDKGDEDTIPTPSKYKAAEGSVHRPVKKAARKTPGSEYKAKKASGDIKKGKLEPYAYLPLNRQSLNRRKRVKVTGQFKGIIGAAKRGALKGRKAKSRKSKMQG